MRHSAQLIANKENRGLEVRERRAFTRVGIEGITESFATRRFLNERKINVEMLWYLLLVFGSEKPETMNVVRSSLFFGKNDGSQYSSGRQSVMNAYF